VILWVPLTNGVDRLGVVQFDLDRIDAYRRGSISIIAKLLASEIVAKGQYTDVVAIARRTRELSLSAELQWNMLRPLTFATDDVTLAAAVEPSYGVGGDGYDYANNNGIFHAALFDAVGHDLDASIVANLFVATFRWCRRRGLDLETTAQTIDQIINERFPDAKYATGILAELNVATGAFRWINAGHPAPILICGDRIVGPLESAPAPPLGLAAYLGEPAGTVNEVSLQPGDRVLLYTDGLVEARMAGGEDFGLGRLREFIHRAVASGFSGGETVRRLAHAVVDHHGDHLRDDATIVLVHWHPSK
jgi:serine phosphatase RsbU (regulator of sigma subunit)